MALPVNVQLVEEVGGLTPSLFNMPDQPTLDAFVQKFINRADAWMAGHMLGNYNLLTPSWAPVLQEEGQIYLTLEKLAATLKSQKTMGTHFPYMSEDSPAYQNLIDTDWAERAMSALDLWITVEVGGNRSFAMPVLLLTMPIDPACELAPMSSQYSAELDFARGLADPDLGTIRR